jgi:hypothetical protein
MLPQLVRAYRNHPALAIPYSTCGSSVFPETATEDSCSLLLLDQRFLRRLHALPSRTQGPIPAYVNNTSSTASRISDPIMLTGEHRSSGLQGVCAYKPLIPSQQCACHTYKQPSVHDQDTTRQGSHGFQTVPRPTCHRPQVIRFYPTGGPLQLKALSCISFS